MSSDIFESLVTFVTNNYMVERNEVNWHESLVDQGIIDSIGLIEIVSFLETKFGIRISEEDITRENFGSTFKIAQFVNSKL